jgi:CRP-like cAMP-binding protein
MSTESVLARVSLFSDLDAATIESLNAFTFRRTFSPGEVIFEEGRTGNGLFVVLSGQVEVFRAMEGDMVRILRKLGPGEPFGEMALVGEWPRTASVRAVEPTECLGMDRWIFLAHLNKEPQLAIRMLQILAQRLADTPDRLEE